MENTDKIKIIIRRVWVETDIIEHGKPKFIEITNQVKLCANLLGGVTEKPTQRYLDACHRESSLLQDEIVKYVNTA